MDVSVFGTGYAGLIQAAALADVGHRVYVAAAGLHYRGIGLRSFVPEGASE